MAMQYLIESGKGFDIVTGETLKIIMDTLDVAPKRVYRLVPDQKPKRYHVITRKDYWYLIDDYGNHLIL